MSEPVISHPRFGTFSGVLFVGAPLFLATLMGTMSACSLGPSVSNQSDEYDSTSPGALASALGFGAGDLEVTLAQGTLVEESVQSCMAQQGFDYHPPSASDLRAAAGRGIGASLPENEFVDRYGFGISTALDEWFDAQVRFTAAIARTRDGRQVLSTEGRRAWDVALFGSGVDTVPETGQLIDPLTGVPTNDISVSLDTGEGCAFEASQEVVGNFVILDPLQAAYDDMEDRLAADPRMIALKRGWSECMRASGDYSFTEPLDARELIAEMALPYREAYELALHPENGGLGPILTPEELADLERIQEFERLLAGSDLACRSERDDSAARLIWEYESEIVREYRELIDEFRNSSMSDGLAQLENTLDAESKSIEAR